MVQSNLLLWGFHSKTFRFWNENTGELVFEHNCGGANRIWDFYLPAETLDNQTISVNGEVGLVSNNGLEFKGLREVSQGVWLMYTSKSEVHLPFSYYLTKVTFLQTRIQSSP
jgi:hypothetical protein